MKLNLGCGTTHLKDCINVDVNEALKPDMCFDLTKDWPLDSECADKIYFFHTIEHIRKIHHKWILSECHRVLKPEGVIIISFPEFLRVAENWINNVGGMRDFWEATIYGRQVHESDFHVSLMDSRDFATLMVERGFKDVIARPERNNTFNTYITAGKGVPYIMYEELVYREIWG